MYYLLNLLLDFFIVRKEETNENISFITAIYLMFIENIISNEQAIILSNYIYNRISFMHKIKMFFYRSNDVKYYS